LKLALNDNYNIEPPAKKFPDRRKITKKSTKPLVYFVNFDMVQSMIILVNTGISLMPLIRALQTIFNWYVDNAVFKEIREAVSKYNAMI